MTFKRVRLFWNGRSGDFHPVNIVKSVCLECCLISSHAFVCFPHPQSSATPKLAWQGTGKSSPTHTRSQGRLGQERTERAWKIVQIGEMQRWVWSGPYPWWRDGRRRDREQGTRRSEMTIHWPIRLGVQQQRSPPGPGLLSRADGLLSSKSTIVTVPTLITSRVC